MLSKIKQALSRSGEKKEVKPVQLTLSQEELGKAEEVELKLTSERVNDEEILVHASVVPGSGVARSPVDIVCVVDISGSMGTEASVKTGTGKESHGLSLLDIVKHAVKTVVHSLNEEDRFALVSFSDLGRVELDLTSLKDMTKKEMCDKVDNLCTEGCTNLWDGLLKGMEVLKTTVPGRVSTIFLLTDGLPNNVPPGGELAMLKKYKDEHQHLKATINTFGFGYSIDTNLLHSLAVEGHGMHSFIPDASFVGTAFVNCITNILVTVGSNAILSLETQQGSTLVKVLGNHQAQLTTWGAQINLCALQYGQSKDIVVQVSVPADADKDKPIITATLRFDHVKLASNSEKEISCSANSEPNIDLLVNQLRLDFVSTIAFVLELAKDGKDKEAEAALADIEERVRKCDDPRAKALLQDISGQCKEAIKKGEENYFTKWGRHYLCSLNRAHLLQQCNNFKDPGIQVYGGELFHLIRDSIDDIFLAIPPPTPSIKKSSYSSSGGSTYSAPQSMSAYYNAAGPCFAGECRVLMASGEMKEVKDIIKGDLVKSVTGPAKVECVIKTLCMKEGKEGREDLVALPGGLRITPYHPVQTKEGEWIFPADIEEKEWQHDTPCEAIYNFVMEEGHVMEIEGVKCVTLGHGFTSPVVSHEYYGTKRVVEDMKKMRGWESGRIEMNPAKYKDGKCMQRDKDGLVCGFANMVARDV